MDIRECALIRVGVSKSAVGPGGIGPIAVDAGGTPTVFLLSAASNIGDTPIGEVHTGLPSYSGAAIISATSQTQVWGREPVLLGAVPTNNS